MNAHTPGPWHAAMHEIGDSERWFIEFDGHFARNSTIAMMNTPCVAYSNAEADAQLIAAAPDLADLVLRMFTHVSHGAPTRAEAEIVLKKAGLL